LESGSRQLVQSRFEERIDKRSPLPEAHDVEGLAFLQLGRRRRTEGRRPERLAFLQLGQRRRTKGDLNPMGVKAGTGGPSFQRRTVRIGWRSRFLLVVVMAVLPMIAIQVWHERDLRNDVRGLSDTGSSKKFNSLPQRSGSYAKVLDNYCWRLPSWRPSNFTSPGPVLRSSLS
jgi:hypothetical protein